MSAAAWQRRRSKAGVCARQYASIERQIRRARRAGRPLPLTFRSRGMAATLTVTLSPAQHLQPGHHDARG